MKYAYGDIVEAILLGGVKRATAYISPTLVAKATRRGKLSHSSLMPRKDNIEMVVTVGRPNYAERQFIKLCKKAGESFPIKKIQLKFQTKNTHK